MDPDRPSSPEPAADFGERDEPPSSDEPGRSSARPLGEAPAIECHIDDATGRLLPDALRWLREHVHQAAGYLCREHAVPGGEVRARIIDDAAMEAAHVEYLDTPGTTDVITFDLAGGLSAVLGEASEARRPLDDDGVPDPAQPLAPPAPIDVDMLLCLDEAERQARQRGHDAAKELLLYALHGVLHCLGYDDHDEDAFGAMHEAEDRVLNAIGVGPIFARESDDAPARGTGGAS